MSNEQEGLDEELVARAAEAIRSADALVIAAGAGMGVDSGLPDFRGKEGFWRAYPPLAKLGLSFVEMANPDQFARDPALAWGFYGHRLNLYRNTEPHAGFHILHEWAETKPGGYFVYTSNVDEHFQKAGFAPGRVVECHGSIHWLQCLRHCDYTIWRAEDTEITVDEKTLRAAEPLPTCERCGRVARPNLLMFLDSGWLGENYELREKQLLQWAGRRLREGAKITVVECGAGGTIPTVRYLSDRFRASETAALVRINPRDTDGPEGTISLPCGALEGLTRIQSHLSQSA